MSSWLIDPKTGDYVMGANGAPQDVEDLTVPAYFRLRAKRGTWLYSPNSKWGSNYWKYKKHNSTQNSSLFETLGEDALQPIVDDGRAKEIQIATVSTSRQSVGLKTQITDARGKVEQTVINPIQG